jgi:hypothetical protein
MMDVICGSIRRDDSCDCAAMFGRSASHGRRNGSELSPLFAANLASGKTARVAS